MNEHGRLHALDNLRAVMMWLGIVLHAALAYLDTPGRFQFHDRHRTAIADLLMLFIHSFRMLVFFVLAGLFAALLARRDGVNGMLKNRLRRIGLPFAVFWPLLFIATALATMVFVHVIARGAFGIDPTLMKPKPDRPLLSTLHLWFIYYLLIYCAIAAAIGTWASPWRQAPRWLDAGARIGAAPWGVLLLALPAAAIGFGHTAGIVPNRTSFIPYPDELIHNGVFFAFGWLLFQRKDALLAHYARRCWRYLGAGLLLFVAYLGIVIYLNSAPPQPFAARLAAAYAYGCIGWLLGFALLGLFARYLHQPNRLLDYLARSSYWVYLLHFPVVVAIGALLYPIELPGLAKLALNAGATTAICLLTYHLLVHERAIGRFLQGRPVQRPAPASVPARAA